MNEKTKVDRRQWLNDITKHRRVRRHVIKALPGKHPSNRADC